MEEQKGYLILQLKTEEDVIMMSDLFDNDVEIKVMKINPHTVVLGLKAQDNIKIYRKELL